MAETFLQLIRRETEHAANGKPARIVAKMNALLEPSVIEALYAASQAGVEIDLIIRGVCTLRPGVKGLSDNIRVRSIVGRFLEHSRIFQFANGGREEIYLGSADWMPRNLFERCEVCFPVKDKVAKARLLDEILPAYLADVAKSRLMQEDGSYVRAGSHRNDGNRKSHGFSAQEFLMRRAEGRVDVDAIPRSGKPVASVTESPAVTENSAREIGAAD
jgi:polyphosphate kinase